MTLEGGPQDSFSDDNRPNRFDEGICGEFGVTFCSGVAEYSSENSDSEWLDEKLVSDDDDEEVCTLKKKKRKIIIGNEDLQPSVEFRSILRQSNEDDVGHATDYLESSDAGSYASDSEGDFVFKKTSKVFFDESTIEPRFELGMIFGSPGQLKEALNAYAVAHRFDFKFEINTKEKTKVVCKSKGCPFLLYASLDKGDGYYKIKTLNIEHQCSITFKNKRANYRLVGKHFLSKLRIIPNLKPIDMIKISKEELKVELNRSICRKAKTWCLEQIQGKIGYEFSKLFDYVFALRSADPGGTFELMVERPTPEDVPKFRRLYVCFSALKEGFKKYCRPVLCLDGCYLRGRLKGEILSAVGRDGNNQIFPIAWAVVEVENIETWGWFLRNIQTDLNLGEGEKFTVISDMQKGLLEEISIWLPEVEHRFCARHMYANWKKVHNGGDLQLLFWSCCKATTQSMFHRYSTRIGELKNKALSDLKTKDPKHWSKAFFSCRSKCDVVDNNFSEAFNSAIVGARYKSIISLLGDIRHYVMNRLVENKRKSENWKDNLCPKIWKKLEENKAGSAYCHVIWNGAEGYEVLCNQDTFVVDVKGWNCTCRVWDLTGIPCPHAVSVILYREERLEDYVIDAYKKTVYYELYSSALPTIHSEKFWKETKMGSIDPPLKRNLPGRPKHKRKREEGEPKNGKKLSKKDQR